ncbi:MAG TPA: prolipoprotein diacylglyceryl transferase [Firmicutes bacterium]|nr:prolipoprotein diacylglyceryl transferase [Bacillota bacterium]
MRISPYNCLGDKMNPVAFEIFGIGIRYYSMFILIGVAIAYFMIVREAKKFGISSDFIFNLFFWTIIIGIIGARLYYVVFNWEYFGSHINEIWQLWQGGLAIHGGILLGLLTIAIYTRKHHVRTARIIDIVVVPLILGQAIGRWGNFFNSEAYGAATTLNHLESLHIPRFIIDGMNINGIYYTPTFFYESLWCILGFIILLFVRQMKYIKVGQIASVYMIWYGIGRFFIEALRTDSLMLLGFKVAQIVSVIFIIVGVVIFILCLKKSKYEDLYNAEKIK